MKLQTSNSKLQTANFQFQNKACDGPLEFEIGSLELNIVAFCCHYCAYAAADLAGSLRIQYPASVKVVKIPCTGDLDVSSVLEAFEYGADGVMVAGCLEGDCHYQLGNFNDKRRVNYVKTMLRKIRFEPDRVRMFNMSSAMGRKWAEAVTEMDETVRRLGPSRLREKETKETKETRELVQEAI
ncbi:MAG: hydrogenase iron-sulfur subunit [Chloroflexi bacterium]|nr:hydrogenase iron-sulfur subunit [Chloroflexota bacterium]